MPSCGKEPLLTSAEMTAKWESYLLKIGERKGTQTTFLANIQKFVSHLLEVVPGQIQSIDFGSTLQEVKAASEKQEAARHLEFVQNARNKKSYSIKRWQLVRLKPVILNYGQRLPKRNSQRHS